MYALEAAYGASRNVSALGFSHHHHLAQHAKAADIKKPGFPHGKPGLLFNESQLKS
jgi:hypothetical protein